jgi:hypothetical protein
MVVSIVGKYLVSRLHAVGQDFVNKTNPVGIDR